MEIVTYELAKKLREKGFDEKCYTFYEYDSKEFYREEKIPCCNSRSDDYTAPTISQVLKWLREEKKIYCLPWFEQGIDMWFYVICQPNYACEFPEFMSKSDYDTYEQAALAGIEYVLENLI